MRELVQTQASSLEEQTDAFQDQLSGDDADELFLYAYSSKCACLDMASVLVYSAQIKPYK